ncbi:Outer membrane porin protein 32 [Pandoraea communis]|uniref:Outer membrane porin protein 32 n=1 Tax=Pandoraea communis TaxID=2508297 RepID=A0A5E4URY9_9BURK|nr:porin [Pandoraea communis]VVE02676.1 Outer membrane porin protein 32 [Pandoraea communis]
MFRSVQIPCAAVLLSMSCVPQAFAQSSVNIAGVIGEGVAYTSNVGGKSSTYLLPAGVLRPNTLWINVQEDLGGGYKALASLSTMFGMNNGATLGAPGAFFSRESYVGLANGYGTLTLGQQRDFMFDTLTLQGYAGAFYQGIWGAHMGPFPAFGVPYVIGNSYDFDRLNGEALNNAVKFKSASFGGFTFGAMYSFGGVPGHFGNSSASSFSANYQFANGGVGAAYTMTKLPSIDQGNAGIRNFGIGGRYKIGDTQFALLGTVSRNTATGAQIDSVDTTVSYDFSAFWTLAGTYTYMGGNAQLGNNHANQFGSTLTYRFSKRTSVYASLAWQRASGRTALARINSTLPSASGSAVQTSAALNIQHAF